MCNKQALGSIIKQTQKERDRMDEQELKAATRKLRALDPTTKAEARLMSAKLNETETEYEDAPGQGAEDQRVVAAPKEGYDEFGRAVAALREEATRGRVSFPPLPTQ